MFFNLFSWRNSFEDALASIYYQNLFHPPMMFSFIYYICYSWCIYSIFCYSIALDCNAINLILMIDSSKFSLKVTCYFFPFQAITALKKGAYLLKYGRRGKPKFCPFRLSNVIFSKWLGPWLLFSRNVISSIFASHFLDFSFYQKCYLLCQLLLHSERRHGNREGPGWVNDPYQTWKKIWLPKSDPIFFSGHSGLTQTWPEFLKFKIY